MSRDQKRALEALAAATERFQAAHAEMLLAAQALELAMQDCQRVNDVRALA
jgi:hypothetical protein